MISVPRLGSKLAADGFQLMVPDLFDQQVALMYEVCSFQNRTVLELGTKDGRHSSAALAMGARSCVAVEGRCMNLAATHESEHTRQVQFLVADVRDLPLRWSATFDIVMAYGILYHLARPMELIRRMRALCRKFLFVSTHCAAPATRVDGYGGSPWTEPGGGDSALTGELSFWLSEGELLRALEDYGFEVLKVAHHDIRGTPGTWVAAGAVLGMERA